MRAAVPRAPRVGHEAVLGPRRDRTWAPRARRAAQGHAVRVRRGRVEEAVRARARGRRSVAREKLTRARCALERGKGDGQVDGAPDRLAPWTRDDPGVRRGGEHVFEKVGWGPDGSGVLQAILRGRYVATASSPPNRAKPTVAQAT